MKDFFYPLRVMHGFVHESLILLKERKRFRRLYRVALLRKKKNNPKCVFLVMTPEHVNLGDHAIAAAEAELLKQHGIDYVEITDQQMVELRSKKCLNILNGLPIMINGGGNMGTLWFNVETMMRDIVKANHRSPIFILPNTIYYEESAWGKEELERSQKIYNSHPQLQIYAREAVSYHYMTDCYRHVKLMPDMVMSLNKCGQDSKRQGCLLCLRSDIEKTRTDDDDKVLVEQLKGVFENNIQHTDMYVLTKVTPNNREEELEKKYAEFRAAQLVITDRLHGMIFCAITGTPCIVINSQSPKVKGCYAWLKHLLYIRFCDDVSKVAEIYQTIPQTEFQYDNSAMQRFYNELGMDIANLF